MTNISTPAAPDIAATLRAAIDAHSDIVLLLSPEGGIVYANQRAAEVTGSPVDRLASMIVFELDRTVTPDNWPLRWRRLQRNGTVHGTVKYTTRGGNALALEINATHIDFGSREYACVIARYASLRDEATGRMMLMQFSIDQIGESVFWIDSNAIIHYANEAACRNLGYAIDELNGMSISDLDPNFPIEIWPLHWEELRTRKQLAFETLHQRKDGTTYPVDVSANYLKLGNLEYNCAFVRNITERKLAEGKLQQMATRDALTNLPNQTLFNDRLERAISRSSRDRNQPAVLFIDIDQFSEVNEQYGRAIGDQMIEAVARRLRTPLRNGDTLSRWSGDTFAVLIDHVDAPVEARIIAGKLLDSLPLPLVSGETSITVSASIGIACYPDDGEDVQTLCKNADIAMFRAAEIGGDTIQIFAQSKHTLETEVSQLIDLRKAMRSEEMVTRYQPEVTIADGRPIALEAQIHWNHPKQGLLPPKQFMQVADDNGYIIELGHWLIETACAQTRAWLDQGIEMPPLAISLTLRQLRKPDLVEMLQRALVRHGLEPSALRIGLPSLLLAGHRKHTASILEKLHALGVPMAIDGFGAAPVIPRMLLSLKADVIRIDCDQTCGEGQCSGSTTLAQGLTSLCHTMDLTVTMVGIDSKDRDACSSNTGCNAVLGNHVVPAMDAETATNWLTAYMDA